MAFHLQSLSLTFKQRTNVNPCGKKKIQNKNKAEIMTEAEEHEIWDVKSL